MSTLLLKALDVDWTQPVRRAAVSQLASIVFAQHAIAPVAGVRNCAGLPMTIARLQRSAQSLPPACCDPAYRQDPTDRCHFRPSPHAADVVDGTRVVAAHRHGRDRRVIRSPVEAMRAAPRCHHPSGRLRLGCPSTKRPVPRAERRHGWTPVPRNGVLDWDRVALRPQHRSGKA